MPCSENTPIPFIDPKHDPAIFVKALASQPLPALGNERAIKKYAGYGRMTTFATWPQLLNKHLGIQVYVEETSLQDWSDRVSVIPGIGWELAEMWNYCESVGYFGGENGGTVPITQVSGIFIVRRRF